MIIIVIIIIDIISTVITITFVNSIIDKEFLPLYFKKHPPPLKEISLFPFLLSLVSLNFLHLLLTDYFQHAF